MRAAGDRIAAPEVKRPEDGPALHRGVIGPVASALSGGPVAGRLAAPNQKRRSPPVPKARSRSRCARPAALGGASRTTISGDRILDHGSGAEVIAPGQSGLRAAWP